MNYQDFICSCIGVPEDICKLLDQIENNFQTYKIYDIEEQFIKVLIHEYGMEKGYTTGNLLIMKLYNIIIDYYVKTYSTYYPEFNSELFKTWINGVDSEIWFNNEEVEDKEQLEEAVEEWIRENQKAN